jgi:hypothetical protein
MITFLRYAAAFLGTFIVMVAVVFATVMKEDEDDKYDQKKDSSRKSQYGAPRTEEMTVYRSNRFFPPFIRSRFRLVCYIRQIAKDRPANQILQSIHVMIRFWPPTTWIAFTD